ncbi:GTP-binding protein [Nannocystis punicea]|uniref:ADP-ribosylation factor-like protein n=1 Tax=Nannocystis punicea TaxID=2995304 RepID=A0ABY7H139_9BACT|nr:ADP-ribosylation factor-like protein [Nannocystis poenicansa]WAS92815.1 ADP-ribosylation factor-like protein [Nannocystis poenicansa]
MPFVNYAAKEINLKLVYYGPGLSGKTENAKWIHRKTDPERRGALLQLTTDSERTLFFDFMPLTLGTIRGFRVRVHVYTVPGQIYYAATRKLVMRSADGVVFVADSQEQRMDANVESLDNLHRDVAEHRLDLGDAYVMQYNKRDTPDALPLAELRAALNPAGWPEFAAVAVRGDGVFDTLRAVTRLAVAQLQAPRAAGQ